MPPKRANTTVSTGDAISMRIATAAAAAAAAREIMQERSWSTAFFGGNVHQSDDHLAPCGCRVYNNADGSHSIDVSGCVGVIEMNLCQIIDTLVYARAANKNAASLFAIAVAFAYHAAKTLSVSEHVALDTCFNENDRKTALEIASELIKTGDSSREIAGHVIGLMLGKSKASASYLARNNIKIDRAYAVPFTQNYYLNWRLYVLESLQLTQTWGSLADVAFVGSELYPATLTPREEYELDQTGWYPSCVLCSHNASAYNAEVWTTHKLRSRFAFVDKYINVSSSFKDLADYILVTPSAEGRSIFIPRDKNNGSDRIYTTTTSSLMNDDNVTIFDAQFSPVGRLDVLLRTINCGDRNLDLLTVVNQTHALAVTGFETRQ